MSLNNNTTIGNADAERHGKNQIRKQNKPSNGKTTTTTFLRYDEAGPNIQMASTHYLSSIPSKHRIGIADETATTAAEAGTEADPNALDRYYA